MLETNPAMDQATQEDVFDLDAMTAQHVSQLGPDPSLHQFAIYMTKMQLTSDFKSSKSINSLHRLLATTNTDVHTNTQDIAQLKTTVTNIESGHTQMQLNQDTINTNLAEIKAIASKSYELAAENKQRGSKGTFIVSGDDIPRQHPNENLFDITFTLIYQKFGIWVNQFEVRSLHRLPNNKVLFSLYSFLPGTNFHQLVNAMNHTPKSALKIFVQIQLFEPYKELYFIARRLKKFKLCSNYMLDENGHTMIALTMNTQSFRFTGTEQLAALGIRLPPQLADEINQRKAHIHQAEAQNSKFNLEKARKERPNPRNPHLPPNNGQPPPHNPLTGANAEPVPHRPPPAAPSVARPQSGPSFATAARSRDPRLNRPAPTPQPTRKRYRPSPTSPELYSPPIIDLSAPPPGVSPVQSAGYGQQHHHQHHGQPLQAGPGPGSNFHSNQYFQPAGQVPHFGNIPKYKQN